MFQLNPAASWIPLRRSRHEAVALSFTALIALAATTANPSSAQIVNGSFELTPAYTGYTRSGATSLVTSTFGKTPPNGLQQAFIDNDFTNGSSTAAALETYLGVSSGSLNGLGQGTVINGSAVSQTFNATAGSTFSFTYDFLTSEDPTFGANNDFSFIRLSGPGISGNGLALLRNISSATIGTPAPSGPSPNIGDYLTETGYINFSTVLSATGSYTVSFGVVNVDNTAPITGDIGSALLVDNLRLTAGATPEPASAALLLLGGPIYLTARRRRQCVPEAAK